MAPMAYQWAETLRTQTLAILVSYDIIATWRSPLQKLSSRLPTSRNCPSYDIVRTRYPSHVVNDPITRAPP